MRALLVGVLALAQALAPSVALAWGQTGHRVTGAIAEPLLTAKARKAIRAILGAESLAEASTWADEMRSSPEPFWRKTANPWHYVTVPVGRAYAEVGAPEEGDAVTALQRFAATLKDRSASLEDKQLALRFTVHIIGDLHQPLHAGNGTDRGGNDVKVTLFGDSTNLHAVWDSGLIDRKQLSYSEWTALLQGRLTPERIQAWSNPDPLVWIGESAALRDTLYPTDAQLSWDYVFAHSPTVEQRLSQGGVRMAAYFNALFS